MDAIRGGAILLVLVYHPYAMMDSADMAAPRAVVLFNEALSPYRMPLLIYLSGLLLRRSLAKPWKVFALGKWRNIGWPYVLWSLITLAATTGITVPALLGILVVPPTFLWFLWFLLAFYGIGWVCDRLQVHPLVVAAVALLASAFLPDFARASRFAFLLTFFMLGHFVARWGPSLRLSTPVRYAVTVAGLVSVVLVSAMTLAGRDVRYEATYVVGPLALVLLVQLFSAGYRTWAWAGPLEYVGRNSIVFYVSHYSIQWVIVHSGQALDQSLHWLVYAAAVVAALAAGFALCRLRETWQPAGWLFTFPDVAPARRATV